MSNELHAETTTGLTLYAVLLNSTGQVWNGATWEAIAGANWTTYDLAMTEAAAGIYLANMPAVALGAYSYVVYAQAGVNPATTDAIRGVGYIQWDGSAELPLAVIEAQTDDIGIAGAGLTALGDTRLANLDATISSRSTYAGGAVALTGDYDAAKTAAQAGDAMALTAIERATLNTLFGADSKTLSQVAAILAAAMAGKFTKTANPAGGYDYVFRDLADTLDRVSGTVNEDGDRTEVTLA
jgi:hypothetical protein